MKKKFNTTGVCYPHLHYMMDNSQKMQKIIELVEFGQYFTINRPRQFGKTTTLFFLNDYYKKKKGYFPINLNFQGVDTKWHQSDELFAQMFLEQLGTFWEFDNPKLFDFIEGQKAYVKDMNTLSKVITRLAIKVNKKIILLIDEVDASSNYEPFLNFLGMLRKKYLGRFHSSNYTFHSIVLAGVHDIKSLKYRLRNPEDAQNNSPWNIAIDFEVDMSFHPHEIAPMLEAYSKAENVTMDIPAIAKLLRYYTAGYPFLISKTCKNVVDYILPKKPKEQQNEWTLEDIEKSVQRLLLEDNTNFDSLIKNLENHQDLYDLTFRIIIKGDRVVYNPDNSTIKKGILYGVFKRNGQVKIHNRVYEQRIYNYMASNMEVKLLTDKYNYQRAYYLPNNQLNIEKILLSFQKFMKEEYSKKDQQFLEREWRLVFLAFIRPIINGEGYTFKEPQISEEKRLDVVITYFREKYIVELKRWYGEKAHKEGIKQLEDYLTRQNHEKGYLVIFEYKTQKTWRKKVIKQNGKEIFMVWV